MSDSCPVGSIECEIRGRCTNKCGRLDALPTLVVPQPEPVKTSEPAAWDLVMADMKARDNFGFQKYGTRLQAHNGRDSLTDAYQEALDLAVYLRNEIYKRDGK